MDVNAVKFRLVQYDIFYNGQSQQGISECLMMLIEVINKGSVPYCGSNYDIFFYLISYFNFCQKNI